MLRGLFLTIPLDIFSTLLTNSSIFPGQLRLIFLIFSIPIQRRFQLRLRNISNLLKTKFARLMILLHSVHSYLITLKHFRLLSTNIRKLANVLLLVDHGHLYLILSLISHETGTVGTKILEQKHFTNKNNLDSNLELIVNHIQTSKKMHHKYPLLLINISLTNHQTI